MIEFIKAYKASDGTLCSSLDEVKRRELNLFFAYMGQDAADSVAAAALKNPAALVDILTTKESSIPAARSINGGRKPRKSKRVIAPQLTLPGMGLPEQVIEDNDKPA